MFKNNTQLTSNLSSLKVIRILHHQQDQIYACLGYSSHHSSLNQGCGHCEAFCSREESDFITGLIDFVL